MNKKSIVVFITTIIMGLALLMIYIITNINDSISDKNINPLPNLCIYDLSGKQVNMSLDSNSFLLLVFFKSDCHYSNSLIEDLTMNIKSSDNIKVVLISFEKQEIIVPYLNQTVEGKIILAHDADSSAHKTYRIKRMPSLFLYDSTYKLMKRINGIIKYSELKGFIND